jgi:Tol biopolymer transport system component
MSWRVTAALAGVLALGGVGEAGHAAYPGLNGRIVFVRQVSGPTPSGVPLRSRALYTVLPDGTGERLLVETPARDPEWSPDGASIGFVQEVDPYDSSSDDRDLFLLRLDGLPRFQQLTFEAGGESSPTWSPDGSQIAFQRRGDIWTMRAHGGLDQRVVARGALSVSWSPDGRWLALTRGDGWIEVVHPDGTGRRRLARAQHYRDKFGTGEPVEWTPSGRILFVGDHGLATMTAGGKERRRVSARFNGGYQSAMSPDGRWIAMAGWNPGRLDLLSADGRRVRVLTRSGAPVHDHLPDWQPVCTRRGGEGFDTIAGTSGADTLCGLGGSDRLYGRAGLDRIFGGPATDRIFARDRSFDVVGCGGGNDLVFADRGDLVGIDCERVRRS